MPLVNPRSLRLVSSTHPNQGKSNSTTNDQDYTAIYTIPANQLLAGVRYRVTLGWSLGTDAAPSSINPYLKLGSTKVYTARATTTASTNATRGWQMQFVICGTADPGASVSVDTGQGGGERWSWTSNATNATGQPVALATNAALDIVPGVAWGTNTNGETLTLLDAFVERLVA